MTQHHERRSEAAAAGSDYTGPLSEVRGLEFCQVAAGPFCGMLLADMGADVIKIESRAGDSMRTVAP